MKTVAFSLMVIGGLVFLSGALLWLATRFNLPLGRLPGDFQWKGDNWAVYFPFMTMLILSALLTLLLNLFFRH
jgi:hypothetical protein